MTARSKCESMKYRRMVSSKMFNVLLYIPYRGMIETGYLW